MIVDIKTNDGELLARCEWIEGHSDDFNEDTFWGAMRSAQKQLINKPL